MHGNNVVFTFVLSMCYALLVLFIKIVFVLFVRCVMIERVASDAILLFIHIRASTVSSANKIA